MPTRSPSTGSQPNRDLPADHPTGPWTPYAGHGTVWRVRVAIIGAGPTGLFLGAALQRRGHAVTVVDRDGGPEPDGSWPRKGVMQFHHAHAFRGPVVAALQREVPEAYARWVELGAEPVTEPGLTRRARHAIAAGDVRAGPARGGRRRSRGWRCAGGTCAAVRHVDGVAIGLDVDGAAVPAELVLDASGQVEPGAPGSSASGPASVATAASPTSTGSTSCGPAPSPARWPARSPGRATSTATRCSSSRTSAASSRR